MSEGSSIIGARASRLLSVMVVGGGLALVVGAMVSPTRVWSNLLVASFYIVTLALGSLTFIAMMTVCGAGWNVAFRRVPEAMGRTLPLAGVAVLAIVALGRPLYSWHADAHGSGTFWFKELWLDSNFLMIRAVVIVALWSLFSLLIVQLSRRQDNTPQPSSLSINSFVSAAFLVVFAFTFSIASFDWLMALEPMWFSTMWGVYQFAGMMMATTSAVVVICLILRNRGPLKGVFTDEHLHDLGKLQVGFSCFWIYIWFSQYMLIWYTNIPEETTWFTLRLQGAWAPVVVANLLVNWIIPFFVLLPRASKRSASVMMKIAVLVLIGRWIDLYQMVFPATIGDTPVFGGWEVAAIVCGLGLFALLASRAFSSARPVPSYDPYLGESLHYHAG
jgi:hypothetical protein